MSPRLVSLHKILKDETRKKILLVLNEKGSVSYTGLMDSLGISNTGLLNYHLQVLGDLLSKNANGQYLLTERGKLALRVLQEFPDENGQLYQQRAIPVLVISIAFFLVVSFLYIAPQHISQVFFASLIIVISIFLLTGLLILCQNCRVALRKLIDNYSSKSQKPGWRLYRYAVFFNLIIMLVLFAFSFMVTSNLSASHIAANTSYFIVLIVIFLISFIILIVSLFRMLRKSG